MLRLPKSSTSKGKGKPKQEYISQYTDIKVSILARQISTVRICYSENGFAVLLVVPVNRIVLTAQCLASLNEAKIKGAAARTRMK